MTFRILSLDGGGTWALLEALALGDLYPGESGRQILSHFDLAVASSGGSIVLAGLMIDLAPPAIAAIFRDHAQREAIFHRKAFPLSVLARVPIFPRYVAHKKHSGLSQLLGEHASRTLADWPHAKGWPTGPGGEPVRVLIMAFDYDRRRADYLRSYTVPATRAEAEAISLADAVHASSNAPVSYFDAPARVDAPDPGRPHKRYWDGAMGGHNNPLLAGVVDALALGATPKLTAALTLGAGSVRLAPADLADARLTPRKLIAPRPVPSPIGDAGRAAGCITNDPPDSATFISHVVLGNDPGQPGRVVRMSPVVQPVRDEATDRWDYPAVLPRPIFDRLAKLHIDAVRDADVDLIDALGEAWFDGKAPNQPIRMGDDLSCQLGHDTYDKAKAAWRALTTS
jgi:hypothetical protein